MGGWGGGKREKEELEVIRTQNHTLSVRGHFLVNVNWQRVGYYSTKDNNFKLCDQNSMNVICKLLL